MSEGAQLLTESLERYPGPLLIVFAGPRLAGKTQIARPLAALLDAEHIQADDLGERNEKNPDVVRTLAAHEKAREAIDVGGKVVLDACYRRFLTRDSLTFELGLTPAVIFEVIIGDEIMRQRFEEMEFRYRTMGRARNKVGAYPIRPEYESPTDYPYSENFGGYRTAYRLDGSASVESLVTETLRIISSREISHPKTWAAVAKGREIVSPRRTQETGGFEEVDLLDGFPEPFDFA